MVLLFVHGVFLKDATFVEKQLLLYYDDTVLDALSFVVICTCAQNKKTAMFVWGCCLLIATALPLLTWNKASSVVEGCFGVCYTCRHPVVFELHV